jgi:hypothetical protein
MQKDLTERLNEIKELYSKLESLGMHKRFISLDPFYKACQEYVKEGVSASGTIKLPEIERNLYYKLTATFGRECSVLLRRVDAS